MLVPADLKYNFQALRVVSSLGTIPLNFDTTTGKIRIKRSGWGKFLLKLWQFFSLLHIFHVSFRAAVFFSDENKKMHHLPALIIVWGTIVSLFASARIALDLKRELVVKNFTELIVVLQENLSKVQKSGGSKKFRKSKGGKIRNQIVFLKGKSFYDLVTIYIPFVLYPALLIVPVAYILDPDLPVLFISSIASENRSWWIFLVCLALEFTIYIFYLAVGHSQFCVMQTFIHATRHSIQRQIQQLSDQQNSLVLRLLNVEKRIKTIELRVNLFNLGYSNILFLEKLRIMEVAIGGGFGALLLFKTEPIFTPFYGFLSVIGILLFIILFNRAFDIETTSEQLKMNILIQSQRFRLKWKRKEDARKTRAIRPMGIKIGGFYKIEREAVPIFTDFVIQQIISLLLL